MTTGDFSVGRAYVAVAPGNEGAARRKGLATLDRSSMRYYDTSPHKCVGTDEHKPARRSCKDQPAPACRIAPNRSTTRHPPESHESILGPLSCPAGLESGGSDAEHGAYRPPNLGLAGQSLQGQSCRRLYVCEDCNDGWPVVKVLAEVAG